MNVLTNMKTILHSQAPVHIGVDVAKAELVADLQGSIKRYPNTATGIARLLRAATRIPGSHLVCESTAGYEKPLVSSALQAGIPASIVPPQRVRQFAKSMGTLAKSDPIDASVISRFASQAMPQPMAARSANRSRLDSLMRFRAELLESLHRETCRHEHHDDPLVTKLAKARIAQLKRDIGKMDQAAAAVIKADTELSRADAKLREVTGVSHQSTRVLLAFLPELGTVSRTRIASLAGLAPFDHDSGKSNGKRFIQAGRAHIRRTLHMAAISAASFNKVLRPIYLRLRKAGKPFKVAIVAITRRLLIHLNSIMADLLKIPVAS
jgi:transposase